jgi:hypothetical protein
MSSEEEEIEEIEDKKTILNFVNWYNQNAKTKDSVWFFQHKQAQSHYYTLHGEDAIFVARTYDFTEGSLKDSYGEL